MFENFQTENKLRPSFASYVKVELKIVNGLVAYVSVEDSSGNKENTKFYDFGTTAITLPAIGK